jgi:hypothetical protein
VVLAAISPRINVLALAINRESTSMIIFSCRILVLILGLCLMSACSAFFPKNPKWRQIPGEEVAQVRVVPGHYNQLYNHLQIEEFDILTVPLVLGIANCGDFTGQVSESEGRIYPQEGADYLMNPLVGRRNIIASDVTAQMRALYDWMWRWRNQGSMQGPKVVYQDGVPHIEGWQKVGQPGHIVPDYILMCNLLANDMKPGTVVEVFAKFLGVGGMIYSGLTGGAVRMVDNETGQIVAHWLGEEPFGGVDGYGKVSGVFGGSPILAVANVQFGDKQALQHVLQNMAHVGGYSVIADCFGNRRGDRLIPGLFNGHRERYGAPCKERHRRVVQQQPPIVEAPPPPLPAKVCPLTESIVEAVLYRGHNNTSLPGDDPRQEEVIARIEDLLRQGCEVEIIEGVVCPRPAKSGTALARATKVADRLVKDGFSRPKAIPMPQDKLAELHAKCKAPACDHDTYPWFFAGYVTLRPPKLLPGGPMM